MRIDYDQGFCRDYGKRWGKRKSVRDATIYESESLGNDRQANHRDRAGEGVCTQAPEAGSAKPDDRRPGLRYSGYVVSRSSARRAIVGFRAPAPRAAAHAVAC